MIYLVLSALFFRISTFNLFSRHHPLSPSLSQSPLYPTSSPTLFYSPFSCSHSLSLSPSPPPLPPYTHSKQHNAAFLKVDIDEADDVAQAFAIRSMPTFVFLRPKDGLEEEIRFSGANKPKLEGLVRAICAAVVKDGTEKKEEDKKSK